MTATSPLAISARFRGAGAHEAELAPARTAMSGIAAPMALDRFETTADGDDLQVTVAASDEEAVRQLLLQIGPHLADIAAVAGTAAITCTGAFSSDFRHAFTRLGATFLPPG